MKKNTPKNEEPQIILKEYLIHLFDIYHNTDKVGTIQEIKDEISIKGHTAWILVFSILVASIGLNVSSSAVVIGAMLISPLMGPILGLGLSIAINDLETLKRSLINLGAMIAISLITSFLFFSIPLFQEETPELLARTRPDLRDVLIAFSGGLALIIALSRRKEMTNIVAGVAIATALMPPLCTAGYGLAIGNFQYFSGAFFLFIINSTFIVLATYLISKFLKFPISKKQDTTQQKNILRIATFITFLVFGYSVYTFYQLIQEKSFSQKSHNFMKFIQNEGFSIIDKDEDDINYKDNSITITLFGKNLSESEKKIWDEKLVELGLENTKCNIVQNTEDSQIFQDIEQLKNSYGEQLKLINSKEDVIKDKNITIQRLQGILKNSTFPIEQISKEAKVNYSEILSLSFSKKITYDFEKLDTLDIVTTHWKSKGKVSNTQFEQFKIWLKTRLETDKIEIIRE